MDFSKYKKIFYIVAIISMLLSIKSKVFGSTINYDNTYEVKSYNQNITLPEAFKSNYWFCYISNNTSSNTGFLLKIVYANKEFSANYSNGSYIIPTLQNIKLRDYQVSGASRTLANIQTYVNSLSFDLSSVTARDYSNFNLLPSTFNKGGILASNFDIKNSNGDILINKTNENFLKPFFDNTDEVLQNLSFDKLFIDLGDYSKTDNLYLKILEVTNKIEDIQNPANNIYYFNDLTFTLNDKSQYIHQFFDTDKYYYSLPKNALKLKKDTSYYFLLTNNSNEINNYQGEITTNDNIYDLILIDTQDLITTQDEIINSINNNNPSDNTNDIINNNLPRPRLQ